MLNILADMATMVATSTVTRGSSKSEGNALIDSEKLSYLWGP